MPNSCMVPQVRREGSSCGSLTAAQDKCVRNSVMICSRSKRRMTKLGFPLPSRLPKRPSLPFPPSPISGQQRLQTHDFDKNSIAEFTHLSLSPAIHRRKLTRQKQFGRRTTESTTSSRDEDDFTSGERREDDQEGEAEEKHSGRRIQSSST